MGLSLPSLSHESTFPCGFCSVPETPNQKFGPLDQSDRHRSVVNSSTLRALYPNR